MANPKPLPNISRLYGDDLAKVPPWFIDKILDPLNSFLEPVYNLMNGGINLTANTQEEIYKLSLTAQGSTNSFTFSPRKFVGKPDGVIVCQCTPGGLTQTNIGPVAVDWVVSGSGTINVLKTHNLVPGTFYNITLRIF